MTLTDISSTVEKQVTLVAKAVTLTDFFCTVAKQVTLAETVAKLVTLTDIPITVAKQVEELGRMRIRRDSFVLF